MMLLSSLEVHLPSFLVSPLREEGTSSFCQRGNCFSHSVAGRVSLIDMFSESGLMLWTNCLKEAGPSTLENKTERNS